MSNFSRKQIGNTYDILKHKLTHTNSGNLAVICISKLTPVIVCCIYKYIL